MPTLNDLDAIGGTAAKLWTSGETVAQWDYRKSPLDGEVYQRTTAAGSGTTDPANDLTNYAAVSYTRVSALSAKSAVDNGVNTPSQFCSNAVKVAINGIVAGTRTQVLSLSGRGAVTFLAIMKAATGNGTVEIIVDGTTILNAVTTNTGATFAYVFIGSPGNADTSGTGTAFRQCAVALPESIGVNFRRTFVVWYTPATSDTGANATLAYDLRSTR